MALLENDGQKYKEAFSIGRSKLEEFLKQKEQDAWPGMEDLINISNKVPDDLTADDIARSDETPPTTPSERGPPTTPSKERHIMKLLKKIPEPWPPIRPFDNVHPSTRFEKWPLLEKVSTVRPFDHLPPFKPLIEWKHEGQLNANDFDFDLPKYHFKFVVVTPTPSPYNRAVHAVHVVMMVAGAAVGLLWLLMMISSLNYRKHRNRRVSEVVLATGAGAVEQDVQTDRRPSEPGEPLNTSPLNNDLPPPYYECTPYSKNNCVGEEPPPYTDPDKHKQRQDAFIDNERRACSKDDALELKTELDSDNGRIVENLDRNSNSSETGAASNDNVERTHADLKDIVVYIEETGDVKGHFQ